MSIMTRAQNPDYDRGFKQTFGKMPSQKEPTCHECGRLTWKIIFEGSKRYIKCKHCGNRMLQSPNYPSFYTSAPEDGIEFIPIEGKRR